MLSELGTSSRISAYRRGYIPQFLVWLSGRLGCLIKARLTHYRRVTHRPAARSRIPALRVVGGSRETGSNLQFPQNRPFGKFGSDRLKLPITPFQGRRLKQHTITTEKRTCRYLFFLDE
jgi:hypothetical protein